MFATARANTTRARNSARERLDWTHGEGRPAGRDTSDTALSPSKPQKAAVYPCTPVPCTLYRTVCPVPGAVPPGPRVYREHVVLHAVRAASRDAPGCTGNRQCQPAQFAADQPGGAVGGGGGGGAGSRIPMALLHTCAPGHLRACGARRRTCLEGVARAAGCASRGERQRVVHSARRDERACMRKRRGKYVCK